MLVVGNYMRFIPTGVGNADQNKQCVFHVPVHPHGRGERAECLDPAGWQDGSSPRAWGTLAGGQKTLGVLRFIPTGVGNAGAASMALRRASVHPHGRGERRRNDEPDPQQTGSSPRAWGTLARSHEYPA